MWVVTFNELKAVLKVSARYSKQNLIGINGPGRRLPKVKSCKRNISNNTSQTSKKSTKSVPTFAAVKMPPKAVITHNFFAPLRTNDMDTETTGAENTLPEQEVPRKSGRPPTIVMTSITYLIRLQSDLNEHVKGEYEFRNA
jgi:hypothetical protein